MIGHWFSDLRISAIWVWNPPIPLCFFSAFISHCHIYGMKFITLKRSCGFIGCETVQAALLCRMVLLQHSRSLLPWHTTSGRWEMQCCNGAPAPNFHRFPWEQHPLSLGQDRGELTIGGQAGTVGRLTTVHAVLTFAVFPENKICCHSGPLQVGIYEEYEDSLFTKVKVFHWNSIFAV